MVVTVKPKSSKAKNRFANMMEGNPACIVEQRKGTFWFLASSNQKYFFWCDINNDTHWEVIIND
jgi:hypothetical protein